MLDEFMFSTLTFMYFFLSLLLHWLDRPDIPRLFSNIMPPCQYHLPVSDFEKSKAVNQVRDALLTIDFFGHVLFHDAFASPTKDLMFFVCISRKSPSHHVFRLLCLKNPKTAETGNVRVEFSWASSV